MKDIIDSIQFKDKEAQFISDFYRKSMEGLSNKSEYEILIETSNAHHNAFYDYLEKYGMDNKLEVCLVGKYRLLKMIAEKHGIEL
ncbi:hypothetical protein [Metabacillus arenae]|uniref:Uncharacterized protein n=1 Tax=Metabacillus arenae TaxID=2771434 RepID=A0A926N832_9BACI|nr:hypothetical protein [Metabacillus arenae]MBD1379132.1 hypothetical protein [Metabacillus arenae]